MEVNAERKRGELYVRLAGELDHHSAGKLKRKLDTMLADASVKRLTIDMAKVSFMDSSGIGLLIGRAALMRERGGEMRVAGMSDSMDRLMRLSGLYKIIKKCKAV